MEAIILAGGFGTRLRSVVSAVPKPMAPIAGRPFLHLLINVLKRKGISKAILSVGYMADVITSYFDQHPVGIDVIFEIEQKPLGTGGAIAAALRHASNDTVFVFNGDTYLDLDVRSVAAMWPGDRSPIVVGRSVSDTERFGRMDIVGDRVASFIGSGHKGRGVVNAGCYLVPREIFLDKKMPEAFSFESDFLALLPPLTLRAHISTGQFIDIGIPEDYRLAQSELAGLA